IEQRDRVLSRTSLEALVAAQALASGLSESLAAVVIGHDVASVARDVAANKLDSVYLVDDPALAEYTPDGYIAALRTVRDLFAPNLSTRGHTYKVRDFAPRRGASLGKPIVPDCIAVSTEEGHAVFTRHLFQGKITADVGVTSGPPVFATFQAGA